MDRLDALIAIAQLRLRLQLVEQFPQLLTEDFSMQITKPMELAGLKGRLARAKKAEADIALTGRRFDKVLDTIDELHGTAQGHVGALEHYASELQSTVEGMLTAGSNGGPNDGETGQAGQDETGQIISSKTEA